MTDQRHRQDPHRMLSMSLHRDLTTGVWYLDQAELRYGEVRNLMRFAEALPIEDALSPEFHTRLREFLPATLSQQVISVSGVAIATDDFAARDMRVLTQSALHSIQRVIVRFNQVIGRVYAFLVPHLAPDALAMLPVPPQMDALTDARHG